MATTKTFKLTQNAQNAINEMGLELCGNVTVKTYGFPGNEIYMIYGYIKFEDGHKSYVNTQGKTLEVAEQNWLRCVIKRAVTTDKFAETCNKYGIEVKARGSIKAEAKSDVVVEAKADVQIEARTDVNVEARADVDVDKESTATVVSVIPRLETVRQSRSPKKLKAQKLAESTESAAVVEIGPKVVDAVDAVAHKVSAELPVTSTAISKAHRDDYELVMENANQIGNKKFAYIPLKLLFADSRFQRLHKKGGVKVRRLIDKWINAKCDPLRVSPHNDECMFSIIDGYHRFLAAYALGMKRIVCEILEVPEDPVERLKFEATLFATQNDELDKLSPVEKHKANLIIGSGEHIILESLLKKYNIPLKANSRGGKVKSGYLAGYTDALAIAKVHGEDTLDRVFAILCESRWNIAKHGFCSHVFRAIKNVLILHPNYSDQIVEEAIKMFKPISPAQFLAESMAAYPRRMNAERTTLYLEDYLCDAIGMERVYLADKGIERHVSAANREVQENTASIVGVSAS